jgi:predicted Zn-dependent protease
MPGLLNNVAVVLQRQGDENLPKSLEFSNAALSLLPENPVLRETRGEILAGLGRYREAVIDLEYSLRDPTVATEAHTALAKCYAELGMDDLSNQHRRLSQNVVK